MSTEDFIRETFARELRERVPDGHLLMEHLKDEEYSTEDAVSIAFGNRDTLRRLYDQGKVKPQSDAVFREALGLPPRAPLPAANDVRLAAQAPGPDEHEAQRLCDKQSGVPATPPQPAQTPPAAAQPIKAAPRQEPGLLPAVGRMMDGIGTAGSRFLDTVTTNEALHEGTAKAFEMGGKVMGYAGKKILKEQALDAAFGIAGRVLGKVPTVGSTIKNGTELIDNHRKFYEIYDDYKKLPHEMKDLGETLKQIGNGSKKRRNS